MNIENKYLINLKHMLEEYYCETYDPSLRYTEYWNYQNKGRVLHVYDSGKREEIITDNPIEDDYIQLLFSCNRMFKKEIEENLFTLSNKERKSYLDEIVKYLRDHVEEINYILKIKGKMRRDNDKIYPIQIQAISSMLEYLKGKYLNYLTAESKVKLSAPVVASFCSLVNSSKFIQRTENETVEIYCKRICEEFGFTYKEKVRQNYKGHITKKNKQKIIELILPNINIEASKRIKEYLFNNDQPNQTLYG